MRGAGHRQRLDNLLVARGLAATRSRARDLISRGLVSVDGSVLDKPGKLTPGDAALDVAGEDGHYVSRGALKLMAALDAFGFEPEGRNALDVGASTGGFTQVLLERGAVHVTAVDVGRDQLDAAFRNDPRVTLLEGTDARDLTAGCVKGPVTAITADVSFISLAKALPAALKLAAPGCWLAALVKPQFEAGRQAVGKGGVVRDENARLEAVERVRAWLEARPGWRAMGVVESPVEGGSGNREYLLGAVLE